MKLVFSLFEKNGTIIRETGSTTRINLSRRYQFVWGHGIVPPIAEKSTTTMERQKDMHHSQYISVYCKNSA